MTTSSPPPSCDISDDPLLPDSLTQTVMNVINILEHADRAYLRASPIGLGTLGALSAYYVAFSYGSGVTFLLLGRDRAIQIFGNFANNPAIVLVGIPLIPVLLVSLEAYDLEGRILVLWRNSISPWIKTIPLVGTAVEWVWPSPSREPHLSTQDGLAGTVDFLARNISAGLLLPFMAYAVGIILFKSQSPTKRILLGGITFFSLKTIAKVYLMQQEYRRQGSRRVLNYDHNSNPT